MSKILNQELQRSLCLLKSSRVQFICNPFTTTQQPPLTTITHHHTYPTPKSLHGLSTNKKSLCSSFVVYQWFQ
ncbi:hypothetical protein Hanom_Chr16g01499311 [Helianthus anomalus]